MSRMFGTTIIGVCPFCGGVAIPLLERQVINTHYCEDCGPYLQPAKYKDARGGVAQLHTLTNSAGGGVASECAT